MTATTHADTVPSLGAQDVEQGPGGLDLKILCTTVGETAADYLNDNLGFG
jgi:hypothetical protein